MWGTSFALSVRASPVVVVPVDDDRQVLAVKQFISHSFSRWGSAFRRLN